MKLTPDQLAAVLQAIDDRDQDLTYCLRVASGWRVPSSDLEAWRAQLETLRAARAVLVSGVAS